MRDRNRREDLERALEAGNGDALRLLYELVESGRRGQRWLIGLMVPIAGMMLTAAIGVWATAGQNAQRVAEIQAELERRRPYVEAHIALASKVGMMEGEIQRRLTRIEDKLDKALVR